MLPPGECVRLGGYVGVQQDWLLLPPVKVLENDMSAASRPVPHASRLLHSCTPCVCSTCARGLRMTSCAASWRQPPRPRRPAAPRLPRCPRSTSWCRPAARWCCSTSCCPSSRRRGTRCVAPAEAACLCSVYCRPVCLQCILPPSVPAVYTAAQCALLCVCGFGDTTCRIPAAHLTICPVHLPAPNLPPAGPHFQPVQNHA